MPRDFLYNYRMTQRYIHEADFPYFITTNTQGREWLFEDFLYAKLLNEVIFASCVLKRFTPMAFCIMPDHLHLLVLSAAAGGDSYAANAATESCVVNNGCLPSTPPMGISHSAGLRARDDKGLRARDDKSHDIHTTAGGDARAVKDNKLYTERPSPLGLSSGRRPAAETKPPAAKDNIGNNISTLMHSIKSYFANQMYKISKSKDPIWQPRYNFQIINNEARLRTVVEYIRNNHVKANLPAKYLREPYMFIDEAVIKKCF